MDLVEKFVGLSGLDERHVPVSSLDVDLVELGESNFNVDVISR